MINIRSLVAKSGMKFGLPPGDRLNTACDGSWFEGNEATQMQTRIVMLVDLDYFRPGRGTEI
jgi:hypothetical protein